LPKKEGTALSTIFVGNLAPDVAEADLRAHFQGHGTIDSLRLMARRRMAFIEMEDAEAAVEALRGTQLKGRTLDLAIERSGGGRGGPRHRRRR
jgi:RNA recognition motif-containing protein